VAEASAWHVRIEDLQEQAGRIIAELTGAEAGYVTSGAAAGLALGTAACVAGLDVAKMDRLPDTSGMKNEVIIQRAHLNAYAHAIRTAGVKLVEAGYLGHPGAGGTHLWQIEAAITERTAAIAHPVMSSPGTVPLPDVAELAHRYGLPVVVDAAATLPPTDNLRRFIAEGADLVTFSGGKAIGGPQASGILCGRRDLIESVALQHQDMDVDPRTWTWRERYLESGLLPGPPHHGLGRAMKVGKEEIVGLIVALRRFVARDHAAEAADWEAQLRRLADELEGMPGLRCRLLDASETPRPYPYLTIGFDQAALGRSVWELINALQDGDPPICVSQNFADQGLLAIIPTQLSPGDEQTIARRLREELGGRT
jgi:L-seryl-tRNA(Ser) seleniumtransferase